MKTTVVLPLGAIDILTKGMGCGKNEAISIGCSNAIDSFIYFDGKSLLEQCY